MTRTISLKELRPRLPSVIADVDAKMDRFVITKRGKPAALILSIDDYESLLETIDILENTKLVHRIRQAETDLKAGRVKSFDAVEKELGLV